MQKVADAVERPFGKRRIRPQLRQQQIVGPDHLGYRRRRTGQLGQDDVE